MSKLKTFAQQLKDRVPVSEIIGKHVTLKRRGKEWVGLSPFTKEKTPSFTVNDEKQFWHCFSSGKHGDIFSFLTETQNLSFMEALREVAAHAGMEVPRFQKNDPQQDDNQQKLLRATTAACLFFEKQLQSAIGEQSRAYLKKRGISSETLKKFRIGFAPQKRNALKTQLRKEGFSETCLLEAGLLIKPDQGETYDRFRDRIIFPIGDPRGTIIGFGGRARREDATAKYLNSPETPLFHKGGVIYGLAQARKPAFDAGKLLVLEGYMDVLSLHEAGIHHAVAGMGTALTEEQLRLIWRITPEPVICLDGDAAGRRAASRLMARALPELRSGHGLRFAALPEGKDPDELIRQEGRAALERVLAAAEPLSEALYREEVEKTPLKTPEAKAELEKRVQEILGRIQDPDLRRHYRQSFRQRLRDLFWKMERWRGQPNAPRAAGRTPDGAAEQERILLGMMIAAPKNTQKRREKLETAFFQEQDHRALRDEIIRVLESPQETPSSETICRQANPDLRRIIGIVYGYDGEDAPSGDRFRKRFSMARFLDEEMMLQCLDFFIDAQYWRALGDDIKDAARNYQEKIRHGDKDADKSETCLFELRREEEKTLNHLRETSLRLGEAVSKCVPENGVDWAAFFSSALSDAPALR